MIEFKALSGPQKVSLVLLTVLILAGSGYLIFRLLNPVQAMIYQDPSLEKIGEITRQLEQQGIEYQLDATGTSVLVNEDLANKVKVKLAGSAADSQNVGFELFDTVDYSMTEQAQKVTYQRALQGELERTLAAYREVEQARVHIMIPERKLFSLEQSKAKASVSLIMLPGANLSDAQISGVQSLVAASVESLNEQDVIVLNGDGLRISENEATNNVPGKPRSKGQLAFEQQLSQKAINLLGLYFGPDQVAVSVSAVLDNSQTKQVQKRLLGDSEEHGFVTRKKESISFRKPSKDDPTPSPDKQFEVEYNHGSDTTETVFYAGDLKRLNVAIAIVADIEQPQLDKLRHLIIAGLGIDNSRGDQLSVESFKPPVQSTLQQPTIFKPEPSIVAKKPTTELVFDPQTMEAANSMTNTQIFTSAAGLLILLVLLIMGFSGWRKKSLKAEEKQAVLVQFNEWINQSKVEQNAR